MQLECDYNVADVSLYGGKQMHVYYLLIFVQPR